MAMPTPMPMFAQFPVVPATMTIPDTSIRSKLELYLKTAPKKPRDAARARS